jgi:hypothetical protein
VPLQKTNRETRAQVRHVSRLKSEARLASHLMLARFCAAHDQSAAEEFFVVQFLNGPFRFLDGLHLNKRKTLRALVVPVAYYLRVLHVSDAVEQFEEITLSGVEGQVAHVKTRGSDFDGFRFSWRPRRLRTVTRGRCGFLCVCAVSEKCGHPLPECLFLRFRFLLLTPKAFVVVPAAGPAARTARAPPR